MGPARRAPTPTPPSIREKSCWWRRACGTPSGHGAAVGAVSGNFGVADLTIVPTDAGAATGDSVSGLSATGYEVPVLVIWGAGGLLALGVVLVLVRISIRRRPQLAK